MYSHTTAKVIVSTLLALALLVPAGTALAADLDREQVLSLLKGYEWTLNVEHLTTLGGDAAPLLEEIAEDDTLMNAYRFRALQALKLFPTDSVADFLEEQALLPQHPGLSRRALRSFSDAFSQSHPQRVEQAAARLLEHTRSDVRLQAARSLQRIGSPSATQAVERYLRTQATPREKARLQENQ